jgi:hypothetical protein
MYATSPDPNLTAKQVGNVEHQNLQMKVIHFPSTSIKQCCTTGLNHKAPCKTCLQSQSLYNGRGRRGAYSATPTTSFRSRISTFCRYWSSVPLLFMQENVPSMAILALALASKVLRGCLAESALAIVPLLLMLVNELLMADSAPCAKTGTQVT